MPCSSSASSPVTTWSRPCESPRKASERVDTHLTGRPPQRREAHSDQRVFRIDRALHAEAAADVRRDHPQLHLRNFEHVAGDVRAVAVRILRGGVERVAFVVGMILADCRARLDRIGADAIVDELERHHVLGAREGRVGRFLAAHHQRDRDIVRSAVPDNRRARLDRILERDHGRQGLIVDRDQLGGVARLLQGLRHHKGDAVADRAHLAAARGSAGACGNLSGRPYPRA